MTESQNGFTRLRLHDWRQFDTIDLDLSRRLTIITGANGAGKTTLLTLLTQHFGWQVQFLAEPHREKSGALKFFSGIRRQLKEFTLPAPPDPQEIGTLAYANGVAASAQLPDEYGRAIFSIAFQPMQPVQGVYLPSHRPSSAYQQVAQIPASPMSPQQLIAQYEGELQSRWAGNHTQYSATYRLKESLIALATFGYGNRVVRENEEYVATFEGFEAVLREVLPKSLRFERIGVATPEIVLETGTGSFSLDAASG